MTALEFLEKRLSELEALERAATPGLWTIYRGEESPIAVVNNAEKQPNQRLIIARVDHPSASKKFSLDEINSNAEILVSARNNFLPMIRAIKVAVELGTPYAITQIAICMGWREE